MVTSLRFWYRRRTSSVTSLSTSSATSAASGSARSSTAGRFLISKIVFAVGARARITLACLGQKGVRSMNWMWRRHHQLLHLRPVMSV